MNVQETAAHWHEKFNRMAGDLYPGRYTEAHCLELAELAEEVGRLAQAKGSKIVAHNYLTPEFHEIADYVGDSLGLALLVRGSGAARVDFQSVYFMGATAKMILGDKARVFTCDTPQALGCSLVFGTDHGWVDRWLTRNPGGMLATYINSDAALKAKSTYVTTSRNTGDIVAKALVDNPVGQILILPDKFLGYVMKAKALEKLAKNALEAGKPLETEALKAYEARIEIYEHPFGGFNASCYVHEQIGPGGPEQALDEHPDADLLIHPECGCASSCLFKLAAGQLPKDRFYYLSTEQMLWHAKKSPKRKFIVATEKGMVYRLRKEMPDKIFLPVSDKAECRYMKANTFPKLLASLRLDRYEIVLCNDCCDAKDPFQDGRVIHIPRSTAAAAKSAIDRMMEIG
jgi:quinolinate synthase